MLCGVQHHKTSGRKSVVLRGEIKAGGKAPGWGGKKEPNRGSRSKNSFLGTGQSRAPHAFSEKKKDETWKSSKPNPPLHEIGGKEGDIRMAPRRCKYRLLVFWMDGGLGS